MSEIAKSENFENRVINRLREDIGSLMTDEELARLVRLACDRIFFLPRKIQDGYHTRTEPSEFMAVCKELLAPKVKEAALEYIKANPQVIEEVVRKVIAEGFIGVFSAYMKDISRSSVSTFARALKENGMLDPNRYYPGIDGQ